MKKWLPTIMPLVSLVVVAVSPAVQAWILAHPSVSAVATVVGAIVNHWLPSPVAASAK